MSEDCRIALQSYLSAWKKGEVLDKTGKSQAVATQDDIKTVIEYTKIGIMYQCNQQIARGVLT